MSSFITFEGIEGCGKTTQMKTLIRRLEEEGIPLLATREPGGCPISDRIRAILLDAESRELTPLAELLLYAAARAQHVEEVIMPALKKGMTVLCDRFTDATLAYQGYGRNLDRELVRNLNRLAAGVATPDLTVLIDCPEELGLSRAMARINASRGAREERFEQESITFHRKVRAGYLQQAAEEPDRFIVIDGSKSIGEVADAICDAVLTRIGRR